VAAPLAALRGAVAELLANPRALGLQVAIMAVNDGVWIGFWWVFFQRAGTVRGWDFDGVVLLWSVLTTSAGLVLGVLGNARRIGRMVADGSLDAVLALPVRPLPWLLLGRIDGVFVGDVVFGLGLFALAGDPTPARTARFALGVLAAVAVLAGFLVAAESLVFFTGGGQTGELGFQAIVLLGSHPADVFPVALRFALHTVVPAAFVAAVPARLIDAPDTGAAVALLAAAAAFAVLGWAVFTLGLRRYTSGSAWTRA